MDITSHNEAGLIPRVAIISMTDISSSTATGSLLRELFSEFPQDSIYQITPFRSSDNIASCYRNSLRLPETDGLKSIVRLLWAAASRHPKQFQSENNWVSQLKTFSPDIIYLRVVDDLWPYFYFAKRLSGIFGIPIVTHVMDDYEIPMTLSPRFRDRWGKRWKFHFLLRHLFASSTGNLAISESMANAFKVRYGSQFEVFHNGVDPVAWQQVSRSSQGTAEDHGPFKLLMTGSIDSRKDATVISQVANAIDQLNSKSPGSFELILNVPEYCMEKALLLQNQCSGVSAQQYLPLEQYRQQLCEADCLVLARNVDKVTRAYTEYSFHNKLPEYLASGSAILCIGPDWDGSVQFFRVTGGAEILIEPGEAMIREKLLEMAENRGQNMESGKYAQQIAFDRFNIVEIRNRFKKYLASCVK